MNRDRQPSRHGAPPDLVRAVVQIGPTVVRYHRAGQGPRVLLLSPGGIRDPDARELITPLAGAFRVIVPDLPASGGNGRAADCGPVPYLQGIIDGLGLIGPRIVALEEVALAALRFAISDPERTGCLALVTRHRFGPVMLRGQLSLPSRDIALPLLILSRAGSPRGLSAGAHDPLLRFLREPAGDLGG